MAEPLWVLTPGTVPYRRAWAWQRELAARRLAGEIPDTVLLLEHPHVYTIGKRGKDDDVLVSASWLAASGAEVVHTDRGGQVTYHGPGQLVGYPITRLEPERDVWAFVRRIQQAMVAAAAEFGIRARAEDGLATGVWASDAKLVAIGIRVSRGITSHGFALNCSTELSRFAAIVPCGMPDRTACSLSSLLGRTVGVDEALPVVTRQLARALGREAVAVDAGTLELPDDAVAAGVAAQPVAALRGAPFEMTLTADGHRA